MVNKNNKDKTLTRLAAVQALYLYDINDNEAELALTDIINYYAINNPLDEYAQNSEEEIKQIDRNFLNKIFIKTIENINDIDTQIVNLLTKQQEISKIGSILRAILRVGTCELLFFSTPYKVVIDEFIMITKEFYTINEVNFINSILDKIAKSSIKY